MNTMTISPLQQDYVTKSEFNEFRVDVNEHFDQIGQQFIEQRKLLNEDYERHTGMILEQMKHYMSAALEQVDAKLDKKLDKEEFFEYMELHFPRQTRRKLTK